MYLLDRDIELVLDAIDAIGLFTNYKLCNINHYVICFNNIDAKILDINNCQLGWQTFTDFCNIPITKSVIGDIITTYPANLFIPNKHKEQYIVNQESNPLLPTGDSKISITDRLGTINYANFFKTNRFTDLRLLRQVNDTSLSDASLYRSFISAAKNVLCIATKTYFKCSIDYGKTFNRISYPPEVDIYAEIAEVSKDGKFFFVVTGDNIF